MKQGDVVICINDFHTDIDYPLTKGKEYRVLDVIANTYVKIECDNKGLGLFRLDRFERKDRKKIINYLIDEDI